MGPVSTGWNLYDDDVGFQMYTLTPNFTAALRAFDIKQWVKDRLEFKSRNPPRVVAGPATRFGASCIVPA
ncbi:hypothetical protein BFJ68_g14721 [Fusarium oxysporum]|uniref:Uncharacterized protein n=1 Tax=Fusarium oxysporum TaxID=5507 RepID=A0A420PT23_FUSOX|nr:hypothetical protein BFJ71_g12583 [Fusarium oxysporum]RKK95666.1 hypothetical protein BFJ68_g14721 [Fusarium oxysporum]